MSKIVACCLDYHYGLRRHLEELSYTIHGCTFVPFQIKEGKEKQINVEKAVESIQRESPELVIVGGDLKIPHYKILNSLKYKKGILFASQVAQAEFNREIDSLEAHLEKLKKEELDYLFFSSAKLSENFKNIKGVYHLPPTFSAIHDYNIRKEFPTKKSVGILNGKEKHKNTLNSLIAISNSEYDEFVINGAPESYLKIAESLGLDIKDVGFLPEHEFYKTISELKLGIHLSFSESFSYNVLDFLINGTPCLISRSMPWFYHEKLVADAWDTKDITSKINDVLRMSKEEYMKLSKDCIAIAQKNINDNNAKARKTIKNLF